MTLFFENARLIDPEALTETIGNIVVEGGVITAIGAVDAPFGARGVDCVGKCLALGIIDLGVKVG